MASGTDVNDTTPDFSKVLAIDVLVTAKLVQNRDLTLRTWVPQDASPEDQNKVVDKLYDLVDRAQARHELPLLKDELYRQETRLEELIANRKQIEDEIREKSVNRDRRTEYKMTPQERAQLTTTTTNVEVQKNNIEKIKETIKKHEALLGV